MREQQSPRQKVRLNLGCGDDTRSGYINVDLEGRPPYIQGWDLRVTPWPWIDSVAEEILMIDFLEHLEWRFTEDILLEARRVLIDSGRLVVQVPDFLHCAHAMLHFELPFVFKCNCCGWDWEYGDYESNVGESVIKNCRQCGQSIDDVATAAMRRLYGGQDSPGNYHKAAFTRESLTGLLLRCGFARVEEDQISHQWANWNFLLVASGRSPIRF